MYFFCRKVPVSELQGKTVGLFFSTAAYRRNGFGKKLVTAYKKLKETQHDFEVISVSLDKEEEAFKDHFINMPWFTIPFNHNFSAESRRYFKVTTSTLVILGPDGKRLHTNVVKAIEQHGFRAYPFTEEKLIEIEVRKEFLKFERELKYKWDLIGRRDMMGSGLPRRDSPFASKLISHPIEESPFASPSTFSDTPEFTLGRTSKLEAIEEASLTAQSLESLLVSDDLDYVIGKDGAKVALSTLVGKNILLYFSDYCNIQCFLFLPELIEAYYEIKSKDENFEVILISWEPVRSSFDKLFSRMPWLALPFDDPRMFCLEWPFKVSEIPMVVSLGPTGQIVTLETRDLIKKYGANAYPFTQERINNIKAEYLEMARSWPEKIKSDLHEHELFLNSIDAHLCGKCHKRIRIWSFRCGNCRFDLHPNCVLEEEKGSKDEMETGDNTIEG